MNGWQRLWVVVCVLMLIGAVTYGWNTMPRRSEVIKGQNAVADLGEFRLKDLELELSNPDHRDSAKVAIQNLKDYMTQQQVANVKELDGLTSDQIKKVLVIVGIWLATCIGLYAVGWICGWVYRGFRPKNA